MSQSITAVIDCLRCWIQACAIGAAAQGLQPALGLSTSLAHGSTVTVFQGPPQVGGLSTPLAHGSTVAVVQGLDQQGPPPAEGLNTLSPRE